jgi:long-chain acyl-CoA synthetase
VVAIIQWRAGNEGGRPDALHISAWCKHSLEAFKTPRKLFVASDWPRTAGGKTDHARLGQTLRQHLQDPGSTPYLSPLP